MPTHFQGAPETARALDTFIKLTRATESLLTRLSRRGTMHPLSSSQFAVLEALYHLGPLTQGQVSAKLLKSTGNLTLVVDNLEKQGLVCRTRGSQDRRVVTVCLTQVGHTLIEQLFPVHAAAICDELNFLSVSEQEQLAQICAKLGKRRSEV